MSYDGRAVANYVLDVCDENGWEVTNLSLQKILYFCHVWSLIELGRPLIRQSFEAWEFGPVLPYLYREFRDCDRQPIRKRAKQLDSTTGAMRIAKTAFDSETRSLLYKVTGFYSRLRASDLVALSHAEGGPWYNVWNHAGAANPGMKIEDGKIAAFYSRVSRPFQVQ